MLASFASPPSPRPRQWLRTTCVSVECEAIDAARTGSGGGGQVVAREEVEAALRWEVEAASQAEAARDTLTCALVA
eukprot:scaffold134238_cov109-Phaeocystis_antarctica.AAC.1